MHNRTRRISRRTLLGSTAVAGFGLALGDYYHEEVAGRSPHAFAAPPTSQEAATPGPQVLGAVQPPAWTFTVHDFQDAYAGEVFESNAPPPNTYFVAADIEIDNTSDQVLGFSVGSIRLRDDGGYEYKALSDVGPEPSLSGRNLNPGERARGWVWFTVLEGAKLTQLVFIGPSPEFRLPLPSS